MANIEQQVLQYWPSLASSALEESRLGESILGPLGSGTRRRFLGAPNRVEAAMRLLHVFTGLRNGRRYPKGSGGMFTRHVGAIGLAGASQQAVANAGAMKTAV